MRSVRRFLVAFALAALVAAPASAVTQVRSDKVDAANAPAMMDVLVLRPVGLIGLAMSSVLWVPAQLMTLAINPTEWKLPMDHLLARPARYVFVDPIGSH
jgi:hypothetical protein